MAFMGETSEIGVADLLAVLSSRGHSGRLSIVSDSDEVKVYLETGKVILVSSSNHAIRLGPVMLRLGIVESSKLDAAVREQNLHQTKRPLGQILHEAGSITMEDLQRAAEEQCIEALSRVIVGNLGTFMFTRDALPPARIGLVDLNTNRIVLEASRRADEIVGLRSLLPPLSAPVAITSGRVNFDDDNLTTLERQVLDQLTNGKGTLDDLNMHIPTDEVSLWRAVVNLYERGIIVERAAVDDAEPPQGEPPPARTVDELYLLGRQKLTSASSKIPSLEDVRSGKPAGSQSIAAVASVAREVIKSFNAGLMLQAFASFSDDHFRRQGPMSDELISALKTNAQPLAQGAQETILAIRDVRLLNDGRLSAILHTSVPAAGESKKVIFFTHGQGSWQIDAVIDAPNPGGSTMTSILVMPPAPSQLSAQAVRSG